MYNFNAMLELRKVRYSRFVSCECSTMRNALRPENFKCRAFPVPIHVRLDADMKQMVASLLNGWSISPLEDGAADPQLEILVDREGVISVRGAWIGQDYTLSDPVDGACSFIAEALKVQANETSQDMCVHSAAIIFGGRAVLIPAAFRAGKSTLSAVLAARGLKVIADDAVFISPLAKTAISPGIFPRMRLPAPENLSHRTKSFIDASMCLTGKRYGYLALPDDQLLSNGQQTPIGAFVYLNRKPEGAARLVEVPKAQALKTLIWQNFARQVPAGRILASLSDLVASRPTLELQYSDAEDAADLLERRFGEWPQDDASGSEDTVPSKVAWAAIDDPRWRAKPDLVEENLDASHFIADEDSGRIYHLNIVAAAIWRLLSAGEDEETIASLLSEAFPEIDPKRIDDDVVSLTRSFRESGLLVPLDVS
jgi:hypothetical protein